MHAQLFRRIRMVTAVKTFILKKLRSDSKSFTDLVNPVLWMMDYSFCTIK
jgi:hypothetical protein